MTALAQVIPALFKCSCGRTFRATVERCGSNYVRPAGVPFAGESDARPIAPCPACGRFRYGKAIVGRISTVHTCGAKCRSSKGPSCDCSCGGENHGTDYQ